MRRRACIAVFTLPLVWASATSAADLADQTQGQPSAVAVPRTTGHQDGWTVTVGVEARWQDSWVGSDHHIVAPNPLFDIRPQGTPQRFDAPRDSIGVALVEAGAFRAGLAGELEKPRLQRRHAELQGLGNVHATLELGGFAEYWWAPWLRSRAELRQGIGGHHGVVSDITSDVVVPTGDGWTISGGPRLTVASTAAISPYFGVDADQAAASGLPVYAAQGGVRSVGAGAKARHDIDHQWFTHSFIEYERLRGDAAGSPIVGQRGTPNQTMIGFGVGYSFDVPRF
jgi:MipA family protein